jgi:hypothetical protein
MSSRHAFSAETGVTEHSWSPPASVRRRTTSPPTSVPKWNYKAGQ